MNFKLEWISCYIFHHITSEKILLELVVPLLLELKGKQLINRYFFIRYWENGLHLRLRLLPAKKEFEKEIVDRLKILTGSFFEGLNINSNISIEFHDYIPEIERYGGIHAIEIAEKHFQDSSNTVLSIINKGNNNWNYNKAISHAIQLHVVFVKYIIVDLNEAIIYFDFLRRKMLFTLIRSNLFNGQIEDEINNLNSSFTHSYEKQKEIINHLVKSLWSEILCDQWIIDWSNNCQELNLLITNAYNHNKISTPNLVEIDGIINRKDGKQTLWDIYDNYVHMTNNRLGIYPKDESYIAFLICNALKSI